MDFDAASLHEHDTLMHVDQHVRLRPHGQLDLFLENGVRFLDRVSLGRGLLALRLRTGRQTDGAERGCCEPECDEIISVAQVRK